MAHLIHVGIGGWTYEPWRGVFYPSELTQKRELAYASRAMTSIELLFGVLHFLRLRIRAGFAAALVSASGR